MQATLIVAPNHLAAVAGCAAVQISARKIKLMDSMLQPIAECPRKRGDCADGDFMSLVALVRARCQKQATLPGA